ncbi:hypothetical protein DJ568_07860 [Mucilaginibacter hurinus]|uniref:Uncharacterized protein n=1 Tax=Mucilaginibacter hurinus TaxID=2201324 RepID=A0A367GPU1_9SPHI|nr:hypothetical protein [Mucilaginibacter hurinus]RCH55098.1 hypothetical protein DJ568_07860 [Mucilaginibacter hurinus]
MAFTLITAATTAEAHRLKSSMNPDEVILGDYLDLPEFMIKSGKMLRLPNPQSASYAHEMLTLCLDHDIKSLHPVREAEAEALVEAKQLFIEYGINISVNEIQ